MKRFILFVFIVNSLLLSSCAQSPQASVRAYLRAAEGGNSTALATYSTTEADYSAALENRWLADKEYPLASDESENMALVTEAGHKFLLKRSADKWLVDCTTRGPFHRQTPEMTLLLVRFLVMKGRFAELAELSPEGAFEVSVEFSEEQKQNWRNFAESITPYACRPFDVSGDEAVLYYGDEYRPRVKMLRQNGLWCILEIH